MSTPTNPGWASGFVPSAAEWAAAFSGKVDYPAPAGQGGTGLTSLPAAGQILIGTGSGYALSQITAGTGISINNGPGSIEIESYGGSGGGGAFSLSKGVPIAPSEIGNTTNFSWSYNGKKGMNVKNSSVTGMGGIGSGFRLGGWIIPPPGSVFNVAAYILGNVPGYTYVEPVFGFYNSANTRFDVVNMLYGEVNYFERETWSSATSRQGVSSLYGGNATQTPAWVHMKSDGTTITAGISQDGANPFWFQDVPISDYLLGVTHIFLGLFIDGNPSHVGASLTCLCYDSDASSRTMGV